MSTSVHPPSPRRCESGITLAESIVAVGLFGLAIMALTSLLVGTIRASELGQDVATARFLAAQRMDQIEAARYLDMDGDGAYDATDPCGDIDEISACESTSGLGAGVACVFPAESYGQVDVLNGTRFQHRQCDFDGDGTADSADRKFRGQMVAASDYPTDPQGQYDLEQNHRRYDRFRREVYVCDSAGHGAQGIVNVTLDGPRGNAMDSCVFQTTTPSATTPATTFAKYVFVRVKWRDNHRQLHQLTLSSEKVYAVAQ